MSDEKKEPNWGPSHQGWTSAEAQRRATQRSVLSRERKEATAALAPRRFSFEKDADNETP